MLRTGTFHGFAVRARYALFMKVEILCARRRSLQVPATKGSIVPASYASFVPATVGSNHPDKLKFETLAKKVLTKEYLRNIITFEQLFKCYFFIKRGFAVWMRRK